MSNKICCEETEVEKTIEMNERDYLVDILSSEKEIVKNMCTALTEASNTNLRDELFDIFTIVDQIQSETYELAWNYGWYSLEESEKTKIKETSKSLQKKLDELSN